VDAAAQSHKVQAKLLRAVMDQESASVSCAVSPKGAQGLMQLMPATMEQFHVTDPFDAKQNVEAGAQYLKQLLDKYKGDVSLALAAYIQVRPQWIRRVGSGYQGDEGLRRGDSEKAEEGIAMNGHE